MNRKISDKDKKDWDEFISSENHLPDKDLDLNKKKIKRTFTFDLHGYSLNEANIKINEIIYQAYNNEVGKLIIVTGKGLHSQNEKNPYVSKDLGILKHAVPEYIKNNPELMKKIIKIDFEAVNSPSKGSFDIFLKTIK